MKYEVGTMTGFLDIQPYVTIVPPCLKRGYGYMKAKKKIFYVFNQTWTHYPKNFSTDEAAFPPTQLNPNAGSSKAP
jgi:hypothetical protein